MTNTPQRLTTTDTYVRSVIIEAPPANADDIYLADSEANATTTNRLTLCHCSRIHLNADNWGNIDSHINLKEIWFNGTGGDKLVVWYFGEVTKQKYDGLEAAT